MPRMGLEWETQRLGDAGVIEGKMQVCPVRSFVTSSKWDFHGQGGWSMKGTWYAGVSKKNLRQKRAMLLLHLYIQRCVARHPSDHQHGQPVHVVDIQTQPSLHPILGGYLGAAW